MTVGKVLEGRQILHDFLGEDAEDLYDEAEEYLDIDMAFAPYNENYNFLIPVIKKITKIAIETGYFQLDYYNSIIDGVVDPEVSVHELFELALEFVTFLNSAKKV